MWAKTAAAVCLFVTAAGAADLPNDVASLRGRPFKVEVTVSDRAAGLGMHARSFTTRLSSLLLRHGVAPDDEADSHLWLSLGALSSADERTVAWKLSLRFLQPLARFEPEQWTGHAPTWERESYGLVGVDKLSSLGDVIDEFAAEFAVDWRRAQTRTEGDGTKVVWQETATDKIKIKYVDGNEVGRWTFPKEPAKRSK